MWCKVRFGAVAFLTLTLLGGTANAENEGQADLDKATEMKLGARQLSDLAEVIQLCQSAMKKGLDEQNTVFAKSLVASTLLQRATIASRIVLRDGTPHSLWPQFRTMALDDLERSLGTSHPRFLGILEDYVDLQRRLGEQAEAERIEARLAAIREGIERENGSG